MTVTLNQCLALNTRQAVLGALLFQKLAQQKGLRLQPVRKRIMRKQVVQLVAKHGSATWFQHHQRHASLDLRPRFHSCQLRAGCAFETTREKSGEQIQEYDVAQPRRREFWRPDPVLGSESSGSPIPATARPAVPT